MTYSGDINLLPGKKRRRASSSAAVLVTALLLLLAAALFALSWWQNQRIQGLDNELAALAQAKQPLLTVPRELNLLGQTRDRLEALPRETELFLSGDRGRRYALPAVKAAGTGITLTGVSLTGTELVVQGLASDDKRLYDYIRALDGTGLYNPILLLRVQPAGEGERSFQLSFSARTDGEGVREP